MLENLIFFFLSSEIRENFQVQPENSFFELKISSIEKKISQENKKTDEKITGKSGVVMDLNSSSILWEKAGDMQFPMASLTKLMTVLLIMENHDLDEWVKIDMNSALHPGSSIDIRAREKFTVGDLIKGALIKSGNNAAVALAKYDSGTVEEFVAKMNKRAKELGLKNTHFQNPTGFDDNGHYTSAKDLAKLAKFVYKYDFVKKTVAQKKGIIYSKSGRRVEFRTTNQLLSNEIVGMKTGTTPNAGQCLITIIKKDGKELLFVLLGSKKRFPETEDLMRFVFGKI